MSQLDRSLIVGLPPFEGASPEALDQILSGTRSLRFVKDSFVFEQEGAAHSFFLLLDGHVRVVKTTPDGDQVIVRYISPGELLGIAQAVGRSTYPASAIAAVDCVVLAWPAALWSEFTLRIPGFASNAYKAMGTRLQETQTLLVEMATDRVEQRVANALLRLASQTGKKTEAGIRIDFPISRQDIAEMTGTTLHTVSRLLTAWEAKGLVESGRQRVTVVAPHRLMLLAEGKAGKD